MSGIYEFGYRTPRFCANFYFLLQTEGLDAHVMEARCIDIGDEGMAAQICEPLEIGTQVIVILTLPRSSTSLRVAARVCNRHDQDHGMVFLFSSQNERQDFREYLRALRVDPLCFRRPPS
jgi:hypothetical protein